MKRFVWLVPLLAGLATYAPAPWGGFVWDDYDIEGYIHGLKTWKDYFQPPPGIYDFPYQYFRPLNWLTHLVDASLFGPGAAAGPHAANVLYHLVTTYFLWLLARRVLRDAPAGRTGALLAATVFAVHPIHTESVIWIVGRSDVLATMLLLPSLLFLLRWQDRKSVVALLLAPVFFLLALLVKEVAIVTIAIGPVLLALRTPSSGRDNPAACGSAPPQYGPSWNRRSGWRSGTAVTWGGVILGYAAATCLYVSLRAAAHTKVMGIEMVPQAEVPGRLVQASAYYLEKLVLPWPQSIFVGWEMAPGLVLSTGILLLGAGLLGWTLWFWWRRGDGSLFFGVWWVGVALAPALPLVLARFAQAPLAERCLYLPSVGAALLLGAAWCQLSKTRWVRPATFWAAILVAAYAAGTVNRGLFWLSEARLWEDATTKNKSQGFPWSEVGRMRQAAGDEEGAMQAYMRALQLDNTAKGLAMTNIRIASLHFRNRDLSAAEASFQAAIAAASWYPDPHVGLARIHLARWIMLRTQPGKLGEAGEQLGLAIFRLQKVLLMDAAFTPARVLLVQALLDQGTLFTMQNQQPAAMASYREALAQLDTLAQLDPEAASQEDVLPLRKQTLKALGQ